MQGKLKVSLACAMLATFLASGAVQADQTYAVDVMTCRAGTITVLAKADKMIVWALDHRGVSQTKDPNDPFNGVTQRCIGVVANIAGKISANGWCRSVEPKSGDWTLVLL